jgi:hypothetical protein
MPRISMWRDKKGSDYNYFDRTISEMFTAGGTGIGVHKYLGPITPTAPTGDATKPVYTEQNVFNIQDLLFIENRDRKYDQDVYVMRGHYQRSDNDFDLSQFGLFLQTGTIVMTFHYNDMIKTLGRKMMAGDVLELFHLKDNDVLNVDSALKRFYVAGDCSFATEGFSPTWYPHLWRVKLDPLVDSQEYKDILNNITATNSAGPMGTTANTTPLGNIISTYQKYMEINEAVVAQATVEVPTSGYDVSKIYSFGSNPDGTTQRVNYTADSVAQASSSTLTADSGTFSTTPAENPKGYLTGDGLAPNGMDIIAGISFPADAKLGSYCLRLDYLPNRLFRFDGSRWTKMEDNVRTNLTAGDPNNKTLRNSFANNTDTLVLSNGDVVPSMQSLSDALRPKADL